MIIMPAVKLLHFTLTAKYQGIIGYKSAVSVKNG